MIRSVHLEAAQRLGWRLYLLGLLLVPVLAWRDSIFPFIVPKALLAAGLLALVPLIALARGEALTANRRPVPGSALIVASVLAVSWFVTLLRRDSGIGFWGGCERMDGLLFQLSFVAGIAGPLLVRTDEHRRRQILRVLVVGLYGTVVYAIGQAVGLPGFLPSVERLSSSFGNSAFYGTYLALIAWLALYLAALESSRAWRVFALASAALAGIVLLLTGSRGPLVGLVCGGLVFLVVSAIRAESHGLRRWAIVGLLMLAAGGASIIPFRDSPVVRALPGIERLARVGPEDPTTRFRLVSARIALEAFRDRPVFGWGLNSYRTLYGRYFDPENLTTDPRPSGKAHNVYVELLAEQGLVGFGLRFLFFGALVLILLRSRSLPDRLLLGGLTAYLVEMAFLFDTPATRLVSALLIGFILARDPAVWTIPLPPPAVRKTLGVLLGLALLVYLGILGTTFLDSRVASTVAYQLPRRVDQTEQPARELDAFLRRRSFMSREVLVELSVGAGHVGIATPRRRELTRAVLAGVEAELRRRPDDYQLGVGLLRSASALAPIDPSARAAFERWVGPVTAMAPRRPEAHLLAGEFAFRDGNVAEGMRHYQAAAALHPDFVFPRWALGRELVNARRPAEARPYIEEAIAKGFDVRSAPALTTLIRMYHALGDSAEAARYVDMARQFAPSVLDSTIVE